MPSERVVDRLLASPHFGERWARHWMDLVRYSDTLGNEADMPIPNAWRYRDYLVRAFNADLPYDRLILEHIGGDLLDDPRHCPRAAINESVLGTAFFWMSEGKRSPVNLRQAQSDSFDNRLDVMGKAFLGLTVACARCHDHKFDPITQEDYYGLYGYLKSSRYTQATLNRAELDAAADRMAALRAEIGRASGAAWARHANAIPRYLMATLRVRSDAGRGAQSAGCAGLPPDRLRFVGERGEGVRSGPGSPDVRVAAHRGSRSGAAPRGGLRPMATRSWRRRGRRGPSRRGARRTSSWPTSADRASGAGSSRTRRSARRRCGPARSCSTSDAARPIAAIARGRVWGAQRAPLAAACKGRSARRRSPSIGDTSTSWPPGGRRG